MAESKRIRRTYVGNKPHHFYDPEKKVRRTLKHGDSVMVDPATVKAAPNRWVDPQVAKAQQAADKAAEDAAKQVGGDSGSDSGGAGGGAGGSDSDAGSGQGQGQGQASGPSQTPSQGQAK